MAPSESTSEEEEEEGMEEKQEKEDSMCDELRPQRRFSRKGGGMRTGPMRRAATGHASTLPLVVAPPSVDRWLFTPPHCLFLSRSQSHTVLALLLGDALDAMASLGRNECLHAQRPGAAICGIRGQRPGTQRFGGAQTPKHLLGFRHHQGA